MAKLSSKASGSYHEYEFLPSGFLVVGIGDADISIRRVRVIEDFTEFNQAAGPSLCELKLVGAVRLVIQEQPVRFRFIRADFEISYMRVRSFLRPRILEDKPWSIFGSERSAISSVSLRRKFFKKNGQFSPWWWLEEGSPEKASRLLPVIAQGLFSPSSCRRPRRQLSPCRLGSEASLAMGISSLARIQSRSLPNRGKNGAFLVFLGHVQSWMMTAQQ